MGLQERLKQLQEWMNNRYYSYSADSMNAKNWERLESIELKINWLIEKLVPDPPQPPEDDS